ncbi:MAG: helix-turn-helix domain-containing protein [Nocardioidaceae bacterium]|nr:MAG: helix-turn-helix domain-containing protein [Nocardioidaceae bacterium]
MEAEFGWFGELSAESRSVIGLIIQRAISSFADWLRDPDLAGVADVGPFEVAPRDMTGIVSLQQTVALVRVAFEVVEERTLDITDDAGHDLLHTTLLEFGREVAFATAEVYARAAEMRGAWDARLEALLVDSVMRGEGDETVRTRASAFGWSARTGVVVLVGSLPGNPEEPGASEPLGARERLIDEVRHSATVSGLDALVAVQGDRLVVVLGGVTDPDKAGAGVARHFGAGPWWSDPLVADLLEAHRSARAAVAGVRAAPGWPHAPRPVTSDDLLPERALAGDDQAVEQLVAEVYLPLTDQGLIETVSGYLDSGSSIEATARTLFVHPNTIRYRLGRAADVTGLSPTNARDAYTYRVALTVGRLAGADKNRPADL